MSTKRLAKTPPNTLPKAKRHHRTAIRTRSKTRRPELRGPIEDSTIERSTWCRRRYRVRQCRSIAIGVWRAAYRNDQQKVATSIRDRSRRTANTKQHGHIRFGRLQIRRHQFRPVYSASHRKNRLEFQLGRGDYC